MSSIRLGPFDLLEYDARYRVLICRECRYAIQKSALQSHLLRHKIYRDERQRLLSFIAQLELFEPDQVPLPNPDSLSIDSLPIISGYRCTAIGCGNLCASYKRMRRHLSEIHGLSEPSSSSSPYPVKLQTFFRGTKLRYFEVTPPPVTGVAPAGSLLANTTDERYGKERRDEDIHTADTGSPILRPVPKPQETHSDSLPKSFPVDLNLETLTYFHHFTTITSLTLPCPEYLQRAAQYWQTDVILEALRRRWLMCGLLAISACHLSTLTAEVAVQQVHRERSIQFFVEFFSGWEETTKHDSDTVTAGIEEDIRKAGAQIRSILCCAYHALPEPMTNQVKVTELASCHELQSIIIIIRSFFLTDLTLHSDSVESDHFDGQEETSTEGTRILKPRSSSDTGSLSIVPYRDNKHFALLTHLYTLPSRMVETIGKPESVQDVLATLSAIAALIECCGISFVSDEAGAAWRGMATWLIKVPNHFNHLISSHSSAALIVLYHWASLVERAEYCGCWFLRGLAKIVRLQVREQLPADNYAIQSLIRF